ncbi:MAG: methylmalonyl Co-A mutase-associated GTPase MeaB [Acidimicrobiia bacterium]
MTRLKGDAAVVKRGVATPVADLVARTAHGERAALARLLSVIEAGGDPARVALEALAGRPPTTAVIGITGAPGAGKSTLTDRLVGSWREQGKRVAVLAIDPSSPFTGGAILGDRVRMQRHETDPDVFVRSMATRGSLGGLAAAAPQAVRALDAAGFDRVLIETVGVGQVEVAIAGAADTTVVVVTPGWGDAVQAGKAGLLEIGDLFVVNKADRDGVTATVHDLQGMLHLAAPRSWAPAVLSTVATDGVGVDELVSAIDAHGEHLAETGELAARRERRVRDEVRGLVLEQLSRDADAVCGGATFDTVVARVATGDLDPYTAATQLLTPHPVTR